MKYAILLGILAAPFLTATSLYRVVDLGSLGGGRSSGTAINAHGTAVGWSVNGAQDWRGFSNSGSGIRDLGSLPGGSASTAQGINAAGQIVGATFVSGNPRATLWTGDALMDLGALGGAVSYATAINDWGMVTGQAADATGSHRAFAYRNGEMIDLGVGGLWSSGYGINAAGMVAGVIEGRAGAYEGFVWTPEGGSRRLGTLGGNTSYAMAVNDSGAVVGLSSLSSGWMRGFVWTDGKMQSIGTFGGGNSYAYGVNSHGDVVGYAARESGADAAFLYRNGVLFDLNVLIDVRGWMLDAAYGINDAGQIVGTGYWNGEQRAFRLDPVSPDTVPMTPTPEPGAFWMFLSGITLIAAALLLRRKD